MNNPNNNQRHADPSNSGRNNIPSDFFMRQQDRPDLGMLNKPDSKMDFDGFGDVFMNSLLRNPNSLNQLFEKGGANPEFFNPAGPNAQNLPFDANLLYNFPNMGPSTKANSNVAQSDALSQSNLYFPNMNGNFLLPPNFGLNNQNIYEDFMKSQNPNQLDMGDKNMFNANMMTENQNLLGDQLLFDELSFKPPEVGQAGKHPNQQNNMALAGFPNQMLLNNLAYGGDLGLNSFLLPTMGNFHIEDLYNMQMQGGVPPGSIPHNIGALPMDLKVENANQMHQKGQSQQPQASGMRGNQRGNGQEQAQASQRAEQKPQNQFPNSQDLTMMNGMQGKNMGIGGNLGMGNNLGIGGNLGMFNFPMQSMQQMQSMPSMQQMQSMQNMPSMQSMQSLMLPKELESQSNLLKYMAGGVDPTGAQENSGAKSQQVPLTSSQNQGNNAAKEPQMNKASMGEDPKGMTMNPADLAKSGLGNPSEMDLLGRGFLDPFLMNSAGIKNGKGGLLDSFGLVDDPSFLEAHSNLYNKMKEKNRYERSLKIERYKNKKRNWAKKIAYDCRKRVADTRLRIKGRFISKKDSEKIQQLVGKQEEAFNEKKNLNLEYLTTKFNIAGEAEEPTGIPVKTSISKGYLLNKIDEILHNNKNPLPPKNLATNKKLGELIKSKLMSRSKKIFKIRNRKEDGDLGMMRDISTASMPSMPLKQESLKTAPLPKVKNEGYPDGLTQMGQMGQMGPMGQMGQMGGMKMENNMLANRMKNAFNFPHPGEGFDMSGAPDIDPSMLGNIGNINMLEALMNMGMGMNMNMGMGMNMNMGLNPYETRPELQHEDGAHEMSRLK